METKIINVYQYLKKEFSAIAHEILELGGRFHIYSWDYTDDLEYSKVVIGIPDVDELISLAIDSEYKINITHGSALNLFENYLTTLGYSFSYSCFYDEMYESHELYIDFKKDVSVKPKYRTF